MQFHPLTLCKQQALLNFFISPFSLLLVQSRLVQNEPWSSCAVIPAEAKINNALKDSIVNLFELA